MTSFFMALPVAAGDAFYLRRDGLHILVDGGRSQSALPKLIKSHLNTQHLDVVVCTHNDSDHANGILGLLCSGDVSIQEIWLPASWTLRLDDLVRNPTRFFAEVARDIDTLENPESLESYAENSRQESRDQIARAEYEEKDMETWLVEIFERDELERQRSELDLQMLLHHPWGLYPCNPYRLIGFADTWRIRLWMESLKAGQRIKEIFETALDCGVNIRLFKFSANNPRGGLPGNFEPVNCLECSRFRKYPITALSYLALTTSNRESLVFYAPECLEDSNPAVLFSADSNIGFGLSHINRPSNNLLVTAPHHGSESNKRAYQSVRSWIDANNVIWVRSDGKYKTRPGTTFKQQPYRVCTICNPACHPKSPIAFHSVGSSWCYSRVKHHCSCR